MQLAHLEHCFIVTSVQEFIYRVIINVKDRELLDKIVALNAGQRQIIEQDIMSLLSEDKEKPGELTNLKHTVYELYANNISHLVADIEVHSHDLPEWIYGFIEMIFRLCALAATEDEDDVEEIYKSIIRYEKFLINYINLELVDYYTKEIKQYKKTLIRFNHHAIKTDDGTPVIIALNVCLKKIAKLKKECKKTFKKCYDFNKKAVSLKFKTDELESQDIPKLTECVQEAKKGLEVCENFYPAIINNGFVSTLWARIVHQLPTVISFLLAIAGATIFILKQTG